MAMISDLKKLVRRGLSSPEKLPAVFSKNSMPHVHLLVDDITALGGVQSFVRQFVENSPEIGCTVSVLSRFQAATIPTEIGCPVDFLYSEEFSKLHERLSNVAKEGVEANYLQEELKRLKEIGRKDLLKRADSWGSSDIIMPLQAGSLLELLDVGFWGQPREFPLLFQYHGTFEYALEQAYWARLIRGLGEVDSTILLSEGDAVSFKENGAKNCTVIPNSIALSEGQQPILERAKTAVYVGRLDAEKSVDLLLKSWARAGLGKQEWKLKIFGSGAQEKALQALSTELKIDSSVTFEGRTLSPVAEIAKAQLHLLASQREGMPMAILEANSTGTPSIVYEASPGVADIVKDGRNGFVAPRQNIDEWTKRLVELASNENMRKDFSTNASLLAKKFTPTVVNQQWRKVLLDSVASVQSVDRRESGGNRREESAKARNGSIVFQKRARLFGDFRIAFRTNGRKIPAKELLIVVEVFPTDSRKTSRDVLDLSFSRIVNGQFVNMPDVNKGQEWVEIPVTVNSECSSVSVTVLRWGTKSISPVAVINGAYLIASCESDNSSFLNSITSMELISRNG